MEENFKRFVREMNDWIHSDEFAKLISGRDQEKLLNDLFATEEKFKNKLLKSLTCNTMYKALLDYFNKEDKNILSLRTFFRERQDVLSSVIKSTFNSKNYKLLHKLRINYVFAKWIMDHFDKKHRDYVKLDKEYQKIISLRKLLCEQNMPLAINRAKIFWSKNTSYHLEYMDLIQASVEGLVVAIDKFVPPYKTVFRSVAIGRMTLNMITDNSSTMIKISPKDRRVLYRATNAVNKEKLVEDSAIVDYVNKSFKNVSSEDLQNIKNAAHNTASFEDNKKTLLNQLIIDESNSLDLIGISKRMLDEIHKLDIIEQKVVVLKNGIIGEN